MITFKNQCSFLEDMTVGISLTNGKEAIVIADSRSTASNGGRQSDSAEKILQYKGSLYYGFLLEAGVANHTMATYARMKGSSYDSLDLLVDAVKASHAEVLDRQDADYILSNKKEIDKRATAISDEHARAQYVTQEVERLMRDLRERKKEDPGFSSCFAAVSYDKNTERVRSFWINENVATEVHMPYVMLGSGTDGAHLYFTAKLQGIKQNRLSIQDICFHVVNAYCYATLNAGVGGTPVVGVITADGIKLVDDKRAIAAVNISGAYLAEGHDALTRKKAIEYLAEVLQDKKPQYKEIARELGLNVEALTTLVIPYSSWQEQANR